MGKLLVTDCVLVFLDGSDAFDVVVLGFIDLLLVDLQFHWSKNAQKAVIANKHGQTCRGMFFVEHTVVIFLVSKQPNKNTWFCK